MEGLLCVHNVLGTVLSILNFKTLNEVGTITLMIGMRKLILELLFLATASIIQLMFLQQIESHDCGVLNESMQNRLYLVLCLVPNCTYNSTPIMGKQLKNS